MLVMILAATGLARAGELVNRVVAVVDDEVVTQFEIDAISGPEIARVLQQEPELTAAERKKVAADIKNAVLQQIIEQKLIESEVQRLGIEVTEAEIDGHAENVKQSNNLSDEMLRQWLSQQGMTIEDFREKLKLDILRRRYVQFRLQDKVRIRDEDVRAYYENNPDEFAAEPVARIAEIRVNVPPEAEKGQLETAFAQINGIYEDLLAGGNFETFARERSQGSTAADGGLMGAFKINTELKPVYRKAIASLENGKFSTIFRDDNGFFILKLIEKTSTGSIPFDQVTDRISTILRNQSTDKEMKQLGTELRKKSFVDIRVNFTAE
jgi:peptidyl-prolyl cis-trans isomerase SurA